MKPVYVFVPYTFTIRFAILRRCFENRVDKSVNHWYSNKRCYYLELCVLLLIASWSHDASAFKNLPSQRMEEKNKNKNRVHLCLHYLIQYLLHSWLLSALGFIFAINFFFVLEDIINMIRYC